MGSCELDKCPECSKNIAPFYINEEEAIVLCINPECQYPFTTGNDIKYVPSSLAEEKIKLRNKIMKNELKRFCLGKLGKGQICEINNLTDDEKKLTRKKRPRRNSPSLTEVKKVKGNIVEDDVNEDFDIEAFLACHPYSQEGNEDVQLSEIIQEIEEYQYL